MVKIDFKVQFSKTANFFFFLANLSEWRSWCRKEYNREWLNITGKMTSQEEKSLEKFRCLLVETSKETPLLYTLFFNPDEKSVWSLIEKKLDKEKYGIVRETFEMFKRRFDKIWNGLEKEELEKDFKKYIDNFEYTDSILQELSSFYSKKIDKRVVNVFLILLPSQIETGGGRYDPDNQAIILEGSKKRLMSQKTIEILFHELIHLYFEEPYFEDLLNKYLDDLSNKKQVKEIISGALLPNGYLSQKYFENYDNNQEDVQNLILTVKFYLEENKAVDENLINKAVGLL